MNKYLLELATWIPFLPESVMKKKSPHVEVDGVDPEVIRNLNWMPYEEDLSALLKRNMRNLAIFMLVIYWIAIPVVVRHYSQLGWYDMLWAKVTYRVFCTLITVPVLLRMLQEKPLSYYKAKQAAFFMGVLWISFFCGLLLSTLPFQRPGNPLVVIESSQTFYGAFGGMCLAALYFPIGFRLIIGLGLTMTAIFAVSNLLVGVIEPLWVFMYSLFTLGATVVTGLGARNMERLRRSDFVFRSILSEKNEKLKELDQAKSRFFANISHELRTPLTMILAPLDRYLRSAGLKLFRERPEEVQDYLQSVGANARRLLRQVNMILDYSKVEAGKMTLNSTTANLGSILKDLIEASSPHAAEVGISLRQEGVSDLKPSDFDAEKMEMVAANLLSNAVKYTPKGGEILVRASQNADSVWFEVKDSGCGIPKDKVDQLFKAFSQLENADQVRRGGTGLGLALVREFVQLHGGRAWVESEVGKGSSFFVEIPSRQAKDGTIVNEAPRIETAKGTEHLALSDLESNPKNESEEIVLIEDHNAKVLSSLDRTKRNILYCDDNLELRKYVGRILSDKYNVFLAANGEHGLRWARKLNPDLILSDLMMPRMNGIEFCSAVRSDKSLQRTPFVLLTARGSLESKIEGLELGADDYIAKPFSEFEVMARIKNILSLREYQNRLKQELAGAKSIQMALLPPMQKQIQGLDIDVLYQSCEELSGDFFDYFETKQGLLFYLVDVTSHGAAAAQITYLIKGILKVLIEDQKDSLDLKILARDLSDKFSSYQMSHSFGIIMIHIDSKLEKMHCLRSGMPSPYKLSQGQLQELKLSVNPLLDGQHRTGLEELQVDEFSFVAGENLFVFSDGAIEVSGKESGQMLSRRLLEKYLKESVGPYWKGNYLGKLSEFHGAADFPDDLTMAMIQFSETREV